MNSKLDIQIGAALSSLNGIDLALILSEIENAGTHYVHLDFFDGRMVKSRGVTDYAHLEKVREYCGLPIEAHLMQYIPAEMGYYRDLGMDRVIIHHEATVDKRKLLKDAKRKGMEVGMALKPSSPHNNLEILHIDLIDFVLVMATRSGSFGLIYDENTPLRIKQIADLYTGPIEVNSGVITYPDRPLIEGTTYHLSKAGATRFSLEKGLMELGIPMADAVTINLMAVELPFRK